MQAKSLVLLGALGGSLTLTACEDAQPAWVGTRCESQRFVYHVRDVDADLCPTQLPSLEEHADVLTSALDLDANAWAKAQYFKYADGDDLRAADKCGPADACTFRPDVHTTRALDEHELVHIYTNRNWRPNLLPRAPPKP